MKFSCSDYTFPLLAHDKVLDLLRLLDFDAVDLGIFEGRSHYYPSHLRADPPGMARRMAAELERRGLTASDVFLQTGPEPSINAANDPRDLLRNENRDVFHAVLEYTTELGCQHLTGLPGVSHQSSDPDADWTLAVEEAGWRVEQAASAGVVYAVEPHVGSLIATPDSTLEFLRATPGLTLSLDYGHFLYQGIDSEAVHPLIPHASHFHARGAARGQLQWTVKDNEIDFKTIMAEIGRMKYSGFVCLEYVYVDWQGCNRTDNISETLLLRRELEQAFQR